MVAAFTGINLLGINSGRWVQNVVTAAKVLALGGVVVLAFAAGSWPERRSRNRASWGSRLVCCW
jgi:amino acid transporter